MTKSPVQTRTITETVIVPGDYGRLRMTMHTSKQNRLSLELLDRTGKPYPAPFFNGDEIKAAGQLLLDVADALAKGARTIDPGEKADEDRIVFARDVDPTTWTPGSEASKAAGITAVATDDDGWIEWRGGDCPVGEDARVDYRLRNGNTGPAEAIRLDWDHTGTGYDIVAYRLAD